MSETKKAKRAPAAPTFDLAPICETSKIPAASRTARCSARTAPRILQRHLRRRTDELASAATLRSYIDVRGRQRQLALRQRAASLGAGSACPLDIATLHHAAYRQSSASRFALSSAVGLRRASAAAAIDDVHTRASSLRSPGLKTARTAGIGVDTHRSPQARNES